MVNRIFFLLVLLLLCGAQPTWAAPQAAQALGPAVLRLEDGVVLRLWGAELPPGADARAFLAGRGALGSLLADGGAICEVQADGAGYCKNEDNLDLALAMVQAGWLIVDREALAGTALVGTYARAEGEAAATRVGLWAPAPGAVSVVDPAPPSLDWLAGLILIGSMVLVGLVVCNILTARRFARLDAAVRETSRLLVRKADIERQERGILAAMLEAELRANKTKTDAFLIIYGEQVERLKAGAGGAQTYRRAGDMIHRRPALQRTVFDRVHQRLPLLGADLAHALRTLYEGVRVETEYIDISLAIPTDEIAKALEAALGFCRALDAQIQKVLPQLEKIAAAAPPLDPEAWQEGEGARAG